jgi:hypothetical protein
MIKYGEKISLTKLDDNRMAQISTNKLNIKRNYYLKYGYFRDDIIINDKNEIIDGYSTYVLAKNFGIKKIIVKREGGKIRRKNK